MKTHGLNHKVLLCAALSASLGACQTMSTGGSTSPPPTKWVQADCPDRMVPKQEDSCAGNGCNIWVQVVWIPSQQTCQVVVGTTNMRVKGPQNEKVTMKWHLPDGNFEFRAEPMTTAPVFATPVMFKKPEQGASKEFSNLEVSPKKVSLDNSRTTKGPFDYAVRVYHKRTGEKLDSPDPSIFNDF